MSTAVCNRCRNDYEAPQAYSNEYGAVCHDCFHQIEDLPMENTNTPVERVSYHTEAPPLAPGGTLELIGTREMLRLADDLSYDANKRHYKLTERWQPGNFDKSIYR